MPAVFLCSIQKQLKGEMPAERRVCRLKQEMMQSRVKGFLDVRGKKIVNEEGEEILLTGWGLGNWLLCEGYMWLANGYERFDRPRRIEAVIEELTGREFAADFWRRFRDTYITEQDIRYIAELGYNSVRIPINSRLFLSEEPGKIEFLDEGFRLLDRCISWCRKYGLYAFLDLHGAPGGQTGANIDDCIDDMPRLFMDQDCFDKGVALWREIALRYKDEWIVGGYDLLNEPIRPKRTEADPDVDDLLPRLQEFYEKAIAAIREVDSRHLFTLEGHHWASDTSIFHKRYDDKMVIHFHRYACQPDISCYQEFMELSERLDCPLWLGETGENVTEWYTAMYPLAAGLSIGYNLWTYKKMNCVNSPCSVNVPKGWHLLTDYVRKGKNPGVLKARQILEEYLENSKLSNCTLHPEVTRAAFRQPGCVIRGTDFDHFPGKGVSFSGLFREENIYGYRMGTGMEIRNKFPDLGREFGFDCRWRRFVLALGEKEFACYSLFDIRRGSSMWIHLFVNEDAEVMISQGGKTIAVRELNAGEEQIKAGPFQLEEAGEGVIRIEVIRGRIEVVEIGTV